jgi:predicted nucleic acid-binding protein
LVLPEFYVTLTRKISGPLDRALARRIVKSYTAWDVVINTPDIILQASEIEESYRISYWDALIVSAAFSKNAEIILTEDLNHGQLIEGILIKNPFVE